MIHWTVLDFDEITEQHGHVPFLVQTQTDIILTDLKKTF
jgi:hypothetical protein